MTWSDARAICQYASPVWLRTVTHCRESFHVHCPLCAYHVNLPHVTQNTLLWYTVYTVCYCVDWFCSEIKCILLAIIGCTGNMCQEMFKKKLRNNEKIFSFLINQHIHWIFSKLVPSFLNIETTLVCNSPSWWWKADLNCASTWLDLGAEKFSLKSRKQLFGIFPCCAA